MSGFNARAFADREARLNASGFADLWHRSAEDHARVAEARARQAAERERLARAVARIFASDDGRLLGDHLTRLLDQPAFDAMQATDAHLLAVQGAWRDGQRMLIQELIRLAREGETG